MKAIVTVMLKPGVLDPAGKAVQSGLVSLGFDEVRAARLGKVIELDLGDIDAGRARERAKAMSEQLLANTVIESFKVDVVEG